MKVFLHYNDTPDTTLHKTLKITLPNSWKTGPTHRLVTQFVETYNHSNSISSSNKLLLDADNLHIKLDNDESSIIPKDAIVMNVLPDRAELYICHGAAPTLHDIEAVKLAQQAKFQEERANQAKCTHFGCQQTFPKGGPYPPCRYHAKPPVFHETAKFWSCCSNKKAYDWETFQAIPGCCEGVCSEFREDESASEKQFLGGCDLRENLSSASQLKSIDDFNRPVLDRLKKVMEELDVDAELFDQVVDGLREEGKDAIEIQTAIGSKLKAAFKAMAVDKLRIK